MVDWRNAHSQIINKIKFQLNAKGIDNLEMLTNHIQSFDAKKCGSLGRLEFNTFLTTCGIFLARQELRTVYDHFNADGKNAEQIAYSDLINTLRQSISAQRVEIIKKTFDYLANGSGSLSWDALQARFRAAEHPRVASREKTPASIYKEFQQGMGKYASNGAVDCDGWKNYYLDQNCTLPNERDDYFVQAVSKTWGLPADMPEPLHYQAHKPGQITDLEDVIYEKLRQRTHGTEDEGKTVKHFFKYFDVAGLGTLTCAQFDQALEVLGCTFSAAQQKQLFQKYANGGKLDYEEFATQMALRGAPATANMNPSFNATREPPHQILHEIRSVINARGIYGIRDFVKLFNSYATKGLLGRHETQWCLRENGQHLSD